jgi:hypothetical protein
MSATPRDWTGRVKPFQTKMKMKVKGRKER